MIRIHIVGCAKTGTTLLQRLFWAYQGAHVIHGEITPAAACKATPPPGVEVLVSKRSMDTAFSADLAPAVIQQQLEAFAAAGVQLVATVRAREAVLNARSGSPGARRYDACMGQMRAHGAHLAAVVSYEELIHRPGVVQARLAEVFNLTAAHPFTDYPEFVPPNAFVKAWGPSYSARPLGAPPPSLADDKADP